METFSLVPHFFSFFSLLLNRERHRKNIIISCNDYPFFFLRMIREKLQREGFLIKEPVHFCEETSSGDTVTIASFFEEEGDELSQEERFFSLMKRDEAKEYAIAVITPLFFKRIEKKIVQIDAYWCYDHLVYRKDIQHMVPFFSQLLGMSIERCITNTDTITIEWMSRMVPYFSLINPSLLQKNFPLLFEEMGRKDVATLISLFFQKKKREFFSVWERVKKEKESDAWWFFWENAFWKLLTNAQEAPLFVATILQQLQQAKVKELQYSLLPLQGLEHFFITWFLSPCVQK